MATRDIRILLFVARFQEEHGYSPSIREIGEAIGGPASTSVVSYNLGKLRRAGLMRLPLTQDACGGWMRAARVIIITEAGRAVVEAEGK